MGKQNIRGKTLLDGDQAQKGNALNCMCSSFNRNDDIPISNTAAATLLCENRPAGHRKTA